MKNGSRLDNRWAVPCNLSLLKFSSPFKCGMVQQDFFLKYLFKYLTKGRDMGRAGFQLMHLSVNPVSPGGIDEITKCLPACEACWRMFAFDIHGREPSTERLVVHLPNMNKVIYHEGTESRDLVDDVLRYITMLTEWFTANRLHSYACCPTYLEYQSMWTRNSR